MNIPGALTGTTIALVVAGIVESALPVVAGMSAVTESRVQNTYSARVQGYKIKDCLVVGGSFVGWQKVSSTWLETPFAFVDDATPNDSKPRAFDKQDFGVWRWDDIQEDAEQVRLSMQHNCDGHLTITTINLSL